MKNLITALLLTIALTACFEGGSSNPAPSATKLPPVITDPGPQIPLPHIIFIYDPTTPEIGTSDGEFYYPFDTGHAVNAYGGFVAIDDVLHGIDDTGTSIITQRLPVTPDAVAISGDVWCFENIDPVESASLGAMARWHTRIWQGGTEYGLWWNNQWETVGAYVTNSGDIVTADTVGKLRSVTEPGLQISSVGHGGIVIHTVDAANLTAFIRDNSVDTKVYGTTNYFLQATQLVMADGLWYSWNGFIWDGLTMTGDATALRDFITLGPEFPVVVPVGSRMEHGEAVTYWIECNTGWLYRHTPSIDRLETVIRLWQGSGLRADGITYSREIKPCLTDDNLFFGWDSTIWRYNFNDALVSSFAAGVEIWGM